MKVKRFFSKSMQAGLKEISQVLGPDAVILNKHKVEGGVEIVAGVDVDLSSVNSNNVKAKTKKESNDSKVDLSNHINKKWETSEVIKNLKPKLADEKSISELLSELRESAVPHDEIFNPTEVQAKPDKKSKLESMMDSDPSFANSARSLKNKITNGFSNASSYESTRERKPYVKAKRELPKEEFTSSNELEVSDQLTASIEAMIEKNQSKQSDQFQIMQSEIGELKTKIVDQQNQLEDQKQASVKKQEHKTPPHKNNYWQGMLHDFGLTANMTQSLLNKLNRQKGSNWSSIAKSLVTQMNYLKQPVCEQGGIFTFLGPTGAGKTTSIGKLASQHVLKNGKSSVGIICMDHHQIGAQASLKLMADILDVSFLNVAKEDSLPKALASFEAKSLVLIDTGGSALSVNDYLEQYILVQSKNEIKHLLCLPATASHFSLNQYQNLIKILPIHSAIITKLDESICAVSAISCILEQQFTTCYLTFGQSIPKDISHANAKALFNFIDGYKHIGYQNNELVS